MSKKKQLKLTRGVWVGHVLKPDRYWSDPKTPEYYDSWYYRIRKVGYPVQLRSMPSFVKTRAQAELFAAQEFGRLELLQRAEELKQTDALRAAVNGVNDANWCTVGQYLHAFEAVAKARKLSEYKRYMSDVRRVIAIGNGLLKPRGQRMDSEGGRIIREVEAMQISILNERTKHEFMRRVQGGDVLNLDTKNPPEVNASINSTLGNARVPFYAESRLFDVAKLNVPWDVLAGFMTMNLPEATHDVGADLPTEEAMKAVMKAWKGLHGGTEQERELALVNELLRLLGLRSGELTMARESWLWEGRDGRTFLWVKNRPDEAFSCKGTKAAKLPLTEDLALRLRERCEAARARGVVNPFLVLPELPDGGLDDLGEAKEHQLRAELVRSRHNAWLKGFIGEVKSNQGNHRLRKFVATQLYAAELRKPGGSEAAAATVVKDYLRHSKEATGLLHYIAKDDERLPTVTDETLAAWVG